MFNRKGVFNIDMVGWGCLIGRGYLIFIYGKVRYTYSLQY